MNQRSKLLESRTVMAALIIVIAGIVSLAMAFGIPITPEAVVIIMGYFGVPIPLDQLAVLIDGFMSVITIVSGFAAIYFRSNPKATFKK